MIPFAIFDADAEAERWFEAIADEPLTTKEGWRRFVDRQPHPPVLLGAVRLAKLSERDRAAYDDGRRGYHADLPLVSTPIIRKVISTSRLLVQLNRNQVSARRGVIISGASGTGKTTALTQLDRTHELHTRKRYPADRHRLPVLYVTVPPAATPRMLAVKFARFLGLEFTGRANITDIVDAVCATAAHTRVELVCVDELHNLNLATRAGAEVSDQLKYFVERLPATFVYAGIDVEAQGLFAGVRGRQIAGRFTVIPAPPFAYGTGAQRGQWRAPIAALESLLRLHRHRGWQRTDQQAAARQLRGRLRRRTRRYRIAARGRPPRLKGRGRTRQLLAGQRCEGAVLNGQQVRQRRAPHPPLQFGHVRPRRVPRAHGPIPPRASGLRRIVVRVGHCPTWAQ
ncbi:MAG: uncharacterized protein JWR37_5271 [Mycobacterium sp.]|nr:uncharacterized protein [Mycobacterium sp.]